MDSAYQLVPADKVYKVFLVEEGDEDRERVLSGLVRTADLKYDVEYGEVYTDECPTAVSTYKESESYTLTLNMVPREDGTYFTIENFKDDNEQNS